MSLQEQLASLLQDQSSSNHDQGSLVDFKAGKLVLQGTTVTADPRKGRLVLLQEEGLTKLQWRLRPSDTVEDNLVVFPGEITVEKVPECTTGRVILLRFVSDPSNKMFFWMQEGNQEKDEDNIKRLADGLEQTHEQVDEEGDLADATAGLSPSEQEQLMNMFRSLEQVEQNQAMEGVEEESKSTENVHQDLADAFIAATSSRTLSPPLSLNALLNPETVVPLLQEDPEIVEAVVPHLPEGQRTYEALLDQLRSPQLQETLARITHVLNQGQGSSLLVQLGLSPGSSIGVEGLLESLQKYAEDASKSDEKSQ